MQQLSYGYNPSRVSLEDLRSASRSRGLVASLWSEVDIVKRTISIIPEKVKRYVKEPIVIPIHNSLYNILLNVRENKKSDEFVLPEICRTYKNHYLTKKIHCYPIAEMV